MAQAHIDLAKAEFAAIQVEIARLAALAGISIVVLLFAASLAVIGTSLFLGEWLLGSIGWGVLHGIMLFVGIALACAVSALGFPARRIGLSFLLGVVVAVVVGVGMALALPNRAYRALGEVLLPTVEPGIRPLVVGVVVIGIIGLGIGVIGALRTTGGFRGASILGGAVAGASLGAISATEPGVQVGAAIGITAGYVIWLLVMTVDIVRTGVDVDALTKRFYPTQTIETSKETLAWLQSKMPPGIGS